MTHRLSHTAQFFGMVSWVVINTLATPAARAQDVSIDNAAQTVRTQNFSVAWNTGADTEAITRLHWIGGPNLTGVQGLDSCGDSSGAYSQYFANSLAPPDPQSGGLMLVGGGTTTPSGTTPWSAQTSGLAVQVTINSSSTGCPPSSAGVDVQTVYRFVNPHDSQSNWVWVQRVFDFTTTPFTHDFRPYVARLLLGSGYTDVIYPTQTHKLAVINTFKCGLGCTGPKSEPDAAPLHPLWDAQAGWFAMNDPTTGQGVVVSRVLSTDPQGNTIAAQLWVDNDGGIAASNNSSFLLISPAAGFSGGLLTEVEALCFYDSSSWVPSLTPPVGCRNAPISLSPWTLTFEGQSVGTTSVSKTAALINSGTRSLNIGKIVASGDFTQTNDCPTTLAGAAQCTLTVSFTPSAAGIRSGSVSIIDQRQLSSPQTLGLAGIGLPAQ
jgi:hypothetical protein